eukprot:SM000092S24481  [mRNA]  locus=s92:246120:249287:+ [translate_table: standard]
MAGDGAAAGGRWISRPPGWPQSGGARHDAPVRLFCFPPAATGAWVYHRWAAELAPDVEVMPVELPGRGARLGEPQPASLRLLVAACLAGLLPLLLDKPFALFGHSMGAWIAYEFAHEIQRLHRSETAGSSRGPSSPVAESGLAAPAMAVDSCPMPVKLYASCNRSPHLADVAHDVDPTSFADLTSAEFWRCFFRRYGSVSTLQTEAAREHALPLLKADFRLLEMYEPTLAPLAIPVDALAADADTRYTRNQISAWKHSTCAGFSEHWFQGGHWLIREDPAVMLAHLRDDLAAARLEQAASS